MLSKCVYLKNTFKDSSLKHFIDMPSYNPLKATKTHFILTHGGKTAIQLNIVFRTLYARMYLFRCPLHTIKCRVASLLCSHLQSNSLLIILLSRPSSSGDAGGFVSLVIILKQLKQQVKLNHFNDGNKRKGNVVTEQQMAVFSIKN